MQRDLGTTLQDCVERPRAKGARWTGEDIQRDEVLVDIDGMDFDSKRDRWNGYDADEYQRVVEEFDKVR
jgi:pre-mRNA-processing factor SLU7